MLLLPACHQGNYCASEPKQFDGKLDSDSAVNILTSAACGDDGSCGWVPRRKALLLLWMHHALSRVGQEDKPRPLCVQIVVTGNDRIICRRVLTRCCGCYLCVPVHTRARPFRFYRDTAMEGWKGGADGTKVMVFEVDMPHCGTEGFSDCTWNRPAVWALNSKASHLVTDLVAIYYSVHRYRWCRRKVFVGCWSQADGMHHLGGVGGRLYHESAIAIDY